LKETLRLYPPASGLSRYNADPDDTWNGYSIGNAVLLVQVYVMHRHPDLWKKPDDFIPARWLDGSEENLNSKFAAFSRGPRDCVRI
jgi:cytochrome P450